MYDRGGVSGISKQFIKMFMETVSTDSFHLLEFQDKMNCSFLMPCDSM